MRTVTIIGAVFVLLGIAGLIFTVIPVHHSEQVAKIGPLTANEDTETDYVIPRPLSVVVLVAGVVLIYLGQRRA